MEISLILYTIHKLYHIFSLFGKTQTVYGSKYFFTVLRMFASKRSSKQSHMPSRLDVFRIGGHCAGVLGAPVDSLPSQASIGGEI